MGLLDWLFETRDRAASHRTMNQQNDWLVQNNTLSKTYDLSVVSSTQSEGSLRIEVSLSRYLSGHVATYLTFYLTPFREFCFQETLLDHLVSAPFSVLFVAPYPGRENTFVGGHFQVSQQGMESEPETILIEVSDARDVTKAMMALSSGGDLTFAIYDTNTPPSATLEASLPNDGNFEDLYAQIHQRLSTG